MKEKEPVNLIIQTVLVFLPLVWIYGFYRIDKIWGGMALMFGILFGVMMIGVAVGVITQNDVREYTNWTGIAYIFQVTFGVYYMLKWSKEWNKKIR